MAAPSLLNQGIVTLNIHFGDGPVAEPEKNVNFSPKNPEK